MIVLFDIDGTLIHSGRSGRRAIQKAFGEVCGEPSACDHISFGGMTDFGIIRAGLDALKIPVTTELRDQILEVYLSCLQREIAEEGGYEVIEGAWEAVRFVASLEGVAMGLGTGNLERGARIKLEPAGFNPWFSFGGFGSDAEARSALILAGARRGAEKLGKPLGDCPILILGDTPRDVFAAHENRAVCFGVATGSYEAAALKEAGAERAYASFLDPAFEEDCRALLEGRFTR